MITKDCRICGDSFKAKTERRQLCDKCQKRPTEAKRKIDLNVYKSKARLGELFNQKYHKSVCRYCGKELVTYGNKRTFCNTECRQKHLIENAQCAICKTPLYPLGIITKNGHGYCSENCKQTYKFKKAEENGLLGICIICKKQFIQRYDYDDVCKDKECKKVYREMR